MRAARRAVTALLAPALAAVLILAGAGPASARVDRTGVYSLSYSSDLVYASTACDCFYTLDYADWRDLGFPAARRASSDFVKYPWSPSIYAVTYFGPDRDDWMWEKIEYDEWTRAGKPAPRIAGWIEGSYYYRLELNSDLFVLAPDGTRHRLTPQEWAAAGYPAPEVRRNEGLVKLSWSGDILMLTDVAAGQGYKLSYGDWRDLSFPTPMSVTRISGDRVFRYASSPDIYYQGAGITVKLTGAQWAAMGFPSPQVI